MSAFINVVFYDHTINSEMPIEWQKTIDDAHQKYAPYPHLQHVTCVYQWSRDVPSVVVDLSLIHISEPTRH